MSAATPRTASTAPELRQLLAAVGAVILAVALLVAATISRQPSSRPESAAGSVSSSVGHDRGWSSAAGAQRVAVGDSRVTAGDLIVSGTNGGAIRYTGIPYPAPATDGTGGSNGTRFPK